jgi:hypothetical protein
MRMFDVRSRRERFEVRRAPRSRRLLSGAIDAALGTSLLWLLQRRARLAGPRAGELSVGWLLEPASTVVREQLASPGQRLTGLRTVDRRTGRRVAPWRTMVLIAASAGGQWLRRRLAPAAQTPEQERERAAFAAQMRSIMENHPQASPERDAEEEALFERYPQTTLGSSLVRTIVPALAAAAVHRLLRRRLAPTVEVMAKRQSP